MNDRRLLGTGVIGSAVAAVCCFTPLLAVGLAAFGLAAWLAYADYVLLPALLFFLGLTALALYRRRRNS